MYNFKRRRRDRYLWTLCQWSTGAELIYQPITMSELTRYSLILAEQNSSPGIHKIRSRRLLYSYQLHYKQMWIKFYLTHGRYIIQPNLNYRKILSQVQSYRHCYSYPCFALIFSNRHIFFVGKWIFYILLAFHSFTSISYHSNSRSIE